MRTSLIIALSIAALSCFGQSAKQIKSRHIRKVVTTTETHTDGKTELVTEIEHFDKKGRTVSSCQFNADSSSYKKSLYTYDRKGNKTSELRYTSKREETFSKWEYEYDVLGNITLSLKFDAQGLNQRTDFLYNNQGDKVLETITNAQGDVTKKIEYTYDLTGMLIQRRVLDAKGQCIEEKKMNYANE